MPPRLRPLLLDSDSIELSITGTWNFTDQMKKQRDAIAAASVAPPQTTSAVAVAPSSEAAVCSSDVQFDPKDIVLDQDSVLGRGACGLVQRAVHKPTNTQLAIKSVRVDEKAKRAQLMQDIKILVEISHENLVKLYAAYFHSDTGRVHVVLELMDGGSLEDLIKKNVKFQMIPTPGIYSLMHQMCNGLEYLHARKHMHRDLKPGNVLLTRQGNVKLSDLGISKTLDSTAGICDTFVGTATYMSPERAIGGSYTLSADIWSIGMILIETVSMRYPYPKLSSFPVLFDFLCNKPEPRLPSTSDETVKLLVEKCLQRNPEKRANCSELLQLCPHKIENQEILKKFIVSVLGELYSHVVLRTSGKCSFFVYYGPLNQLIICQNG
jgi:serine/threonine protein kinase